MSVPNDCSCQKLRVCEYLVLDDYKRPLDQPDVMPSLRSKRDLFPGPYTIEVYDSADGEVSKEFEDLSAEQVKEHVGHLEGLRITDFTVYDREGEACTEHFA